MYRLNSPNADIQLIVDGASANTVGTTGHYNYFIFEHKYVILYIINIIRPSAFTKVLG